MTPVLDSETLQRESKAGSKRTTAILWSIALYLLWTFATFLLENQMDLYQRPTVSGRYLYVLVANVAIGTVGALWVIRSLLRPGFLNLTQVGFRSVQRTLFSVLIAVIVGIFYIQLLQPASVPFLVVINGYLQVLPVSIAEIVVCWVLLGATIESAAKSRGKIISIAVGIAAASVFFSVYHIGHSAPFNQVGMMLFLLVPAIFTSMFWLISREVYATILFHNFQGIIGVIGNLKDPEILNRPLYPLYLLALLSVLALVGASNILPGRKD